MIFLPNKYERYIAALRNHLQKLYFKTGNNKSLISKLKKVYEFEILNFEKNVFPCDIKLLASKLLVSAYSHKLRNNKSFDFEIKTKDNFMLKIKPFTIILLKLAKHSKNITISNLGGNIILKSKTEYKLSKKYLNVLNSFQLYEHKNKTLLVIIKAEITTKRSVDMKREWDILDPFSPVNLYIF